MAEMVAEMLDLEVSAARQQALQAHGKLALNSFLLALEAVRAAVLILMSGLESVVLVVAEPFHSTQAVLEERQPAPIADLIRLVAEVVGRQVSMGLVDLGRMRRAAETQQPEATLLDTVLVAVGAAEISVMGTLEPVETGLAGF